PHIAAKESNQLIDLSVITANYAELVARSDLVVVEGVGGWHAPLSDSMDVAALAQVLGLPIVLVVGIQLGGINYARLTFDAICASRLPCVGWIANCVEPEMLAVAENIATIRQSISAPLLGVIPYDEELDFSVLARTIEW
ncbi:MAG: ATP-dependent dethiobiotin synthetase BioD, partial [Methylococcales bacterium]